MKTATPDHIASKTLREVAKLWALCHDQVLGMKPLGVMQPWAESHPEGLTLIVGEALPRRTSLTEFVMLKVIGELEDFYVDGTRGRVPSFSRMDSEALLEQEASLVDQAGGENVLAAHIGSLLRTLLLSRMDTTSKTGVTNELTSDDVVNVLRMLSRI